MRSIQRSSLAWLLLLTVLFGMKTAAAAPDTGAPDIERIDAFVRQQMQRHGIPGLSLALVEGDQVIFLKGYGKADQTGRPITPQTPFVVASVSKPITASAVMQLVEEGKIDLDAPVQRYLPEFRLADPIASKQITVRHLLLHTSGIPITACDTRVNSDTLSEYVAELQTVPLAAPVGTRRIYCSGNYNVLGRIIETVSGQSFGSYMEQHVFAPLQMQHSFTTEEEARQAGLAQGYQWFFGFTVPTHQPFNPSQLPSGYLISSAEDMSHFLVAQLNGGRYDTTRLLTANSIAVMQSPVTNRGEEGGYGLAWSISPVGDVPAVWHDGVHPDIQTMLLLQPETQRGAVVLINAFGLIPSLGAYPDLKAGIARLLAGLEPATGQGMSVGRTYLIVDALFLLLLVIALWPLLRMRKWHRGLVERQQGGHLPLTLGLLRATFEIGFGLVFLTGIRSFAGMNLGAQSWYELLTAFPDVVVWIWAIALIGIATGGIRLGLLLQARRAAVRKSLAIPA